MSATEYEGRWKIFTPAKPTEFKNIETPSFSPLPGSCLTFRFEAWYQKVDSNPEVGLFKLKLVKLTSFCVSPSLEVKISVNVCYSDGSSFVEYSNLPSQVVDQMNALTFKDAVRSYANDYSIWSDDFGKMNSGTLIIKCNLTFSDQSRASINGTKSSKNNGLIGNFKSIYEPSVLSDFTFKVADRSFPAHKVILAAHSPVFMKMMTNEFLESKTNTVTITDAKPEIFELFLKYLYSGEIGDTSLDSLKELCILADKYDVGCLKKECTPLVISFLSIDLVCEILKFAYSIPVFDIKIAAIHFAVNHIKEIALRDDWKELVETQPKIGYEVMVNFMPK